MRLGIFVSTSSFDTLKDPFRTCWISFPYCLDFCLLTLQQCWVLSLDPFSNPWTFPDWGASWWWRWLTPLNSSEWTSIFCRGHSSVWNFCQQWVVGQKITENGLWTAFDLTLELPGYSVAHQSNPEDVEFTFLSQSHSKQFSISELLWPLKKKPQLFSMTGTGLFTLKILANCPGKGRGWQ